MAHFFDLYSMLWGVCLAVPMVTGVQLVVRGSQSQHVMWRAQLVTGMLMLFSAAYMIIRTWLVTHHIINTTTEINLFITLDSALIALFGLVPYTIICEKFPKWWMFVLSLSPLCMVPLVFLDCSEQAIWCSHLLPLLIGGYALQYVVRHSHHKEQQLPEFFANPELHSTRWVVYISLAYVVITLFSLLRYLVEDSFLVILLPYLLWTLLMVPLFIFLTYQLPTVETIKSYGEVSEETKSKNYELIAFTLEQKCIQEQMYLKSDLSIDVLARACNTNRTYLSAYLKEELHQNFYEYINLLRLKHVDELLRTTSLSQEAIATQCGFNSARTLRSVYLRLRGKEIGS